MGLEKLVNEIISQAEKKAAAVRSEGMQQAEEIKAMAGEKAVKNIEKTVKKSREIVEKMERMEISSQKLALDKRFIEAKKELVDETFARVRKKISSMGKQQRKQVLAMLVKSALKELPDAACYYCKEEDKALVKSAAKGLSWNGSIKGLGGVIVENESQTIRVNKTFDSILGKVEEEHLNEVSAKIFW